MHRSLTVFSKRNVILREDILLQRFNKKKAGDYFFRYLCPLDYNLNGKYEIKSFIGLAGNAFADCRKR